MRISYFSLTGLRRRRRASRSGRSRSLLCLPVLAVALLAFVLPQAAGAATWKIQETTLPPEAYNNEERFEGVSCIISTTQCRATGYYTKLGGSHYIPLAEAGFTGTWTFESMAVPITDPPLEFPGVSCVVLNVCESVGFYKSGANPPLIERLSSGKWTLQTAPEPSGSLSSKLLAVSCSHLAEDQCTAVGQYETSSHTHSTYAERWNRKEWILQTTANPSGATSFGTETGVSCTTTKACTMVGYYHTSSGIQPFAENWNGTAWSLQAVPIPSGGTEARLTDVSCSAASACTAVGYYRHENRELTLAERWNGTAWSVQSTPNSLLGSTALVGVSCPSATSCMAVGATEAPPGETHPVAEQWNGTEWSALSVPGEAVDLLKVSCGFSTSCVAIGRNLATGEEGRFAEVYN